MIQGLRGRIGGSSVPRGRLRCYSSLLCDVKGWGNMGNCGVTVPDAPKGG